VGVHRQLKSMPKDKPCVEECESESISVVREPLNPYYTNPKINMVQDENAPRMSMANRRSDPNASRLRVELAYLYDILDVCGFRK
jgi:hypothetical protein